MEGFSIKMDDRDFEELARKQQELAEQEIAQMQQALEQSNKNIDKQQKDILEHAIDENLEEHNSKKSTLWIVLLLVLILGGTYLRLNIQQPTRRYDEAVQYFENGAYEAARDGFERLGDYKDSMEMVKECDYRYGSLLLAREKYNSAINVFSRIVDYKDRNDVVADLSGTAVNTVATGERHSVFVRSVGTAKAVGDNSNGQCNVSEWRQVAEVACGADFTAARTYMGKVLVTNAVLDWRDIREIAAGTDFIAGINGHGQLHYYKNGSTVYLNNIRQVKACGDVLACVTENGNAVVSGAAVDVSLWNGLDEIATDGQAVYGLKNDGTVISTNGRLAGLTGIKHIFAAANTVFAVDKENHAHIEGAVPSSEFYAKDALGSGDFNFTLMLSGWKDHLLVLDHTGRVKFFGTAQSGDNNTDDWSDIMFAVRQR